MGPISTTRRSVGAAAARAPPKGMPEYLWIDSETQPYQGGTTPYQGPGNEPTVVTSPPMVRTGMKGTTVKELRNAFEARAHTQGSSQTAQANAELRAQQAVQECLHQSFTMEAKCRAILATRETHTRAVLIGIGQRHDALELTEERLSEARTKVKALWESLQLDPACLTASQAQELDEVHYRLTEEVIRAEAEVAARSETLRRFAAVAAAKAAQEQVEYRDAITRTRSAAEARYQTELQRERKAHWYAREVQHSDASSTVKHNCDLALRARESELMRERMLKGIEMNDLCASGQQLVAQLQCALREIELSRTRSSLDQLTADSPPPAIPSEYL